MEFSASCSGQFNDCYIMIRKFFYLFMTAALLCGVACSSSDGGDGPNGNGDGPTGTIDEINGTKIIAGNSLVG